MSYTLADLRRAAESLWPADTAETWDRVGLVTGSDTAQLRRVLFAVDAVRATVAEAIEWQADALVTHHPLLLRGVHTLAEDTAKGLLIAMLIRGNCALLTAHTNADAAQGGVSDVLATKIGISHPAPIVLGRDQHSGIGRIGSLPAPVALYAFARHLAAQLPHTVSGVRVGGNSKRPVHRVAICGGAGDSLLAHPLVRGADVYVTSDLRHHPAQEFLEQSSVTDGPALIDISHWAAESLWLQHAATQLGQALPGVEFRVSTQSTDPWNLSISTDRL